MQSKLTIALIYVNCCLCAAPVCAENINPYDVHNKYAWNENTGWINFDPYLQVGAQVSGTKLTGWLWGENIGWIKLSCTGKECVTRPFGIVNDGAGNLSGFAWGENVGWINFDPDVPLDKKNLYRVRILPDGCFSGWAWGENIGWIQFDEDEKWDVQVCIVQLEDLTNFASHWLKTSSLANLDGTGQVDLKDFDIFSSWWQNYCPSGWTLK